MAPKILPGSVCYLENHSSRPAFYLVYAVELGNVYEVVRRRGRLGSSGQWPPARAIVRTAAVARNECLRLVAARQRSGYQASGLPPQIVASLRREDPSFAPTPVPAMPAAAPERTRVTRADVLASARYVIVPSRLASMADATWHEIYLGARGEVHVTGTPSLTTAAVETIMSALFGRDIVDESAQIIALAGPSPAGPQLSVELHDLAGFRGSNVLDRRFAERHAMLRELVEALIAADAMPRMVGLAELVSGPERERAMAGGACFVRDLTATGSAGWHVLGA